MQLNLNKLKNVFVESLGVDESEDFSKLEFSKHSHWDSIAHMQLVGNLETAFDIMLDTEDVINLSSFNIAITLLKKYGIEIDA